MITVINLVGSIIIGLELIANNPMGVIAGILLLLLNLVADHISADWI